jgi:hypothetical protein
VTRLDLRIVWAAAVLGALFAPTAAFAEDKPEAPRGFSAAAAAPASSSIRPVEKAPAAPSQGQAPVATAAPAATKQAAPGKAGAGAPPSVNAAAPPPGNAAAQTAAKAPAKSTATAAKAPAKGADKAPKGQKAAPQEQAQAPAAPAALPADNPAARLESMRVVAVEAYNRRDWNAASEAAVAFVSALDAAQLPHAGADFALVQFIGGSARFEMWKADPDNFKFDYRKDVLGAMTESLAILQDDPFFKHNVLGSAYYEVMKKGNFRDLDAENAGNWHMFRALTARSEDLQDRNVARDSEEYTAFAKYILQYIARSFEAARYSAVPNVYLVRVREACRMGFGSKFDERFAQLYQVVGFDGGNVRAGVLWQTGLDLMNTEGELPDDVLGVFKEAAVAARGPRERAEIYRQMADFASRQDGHAFKLQAVEYGRLAFRLDPSNKDIQLQYGTSLHVVSYAHYNQGRFEDALSFAKEATSFEWDGDEVGLFDLSRAQANFGDKINALQHAEAAYDKARRKYSGAEVAPFRQNYANILRQFGFAQKAAEVEADGGRS